MWWTKKKQPSFSSPIRAKKAGLTKRRPRDKIRVCVYVPSKCAADRHWRVADGVNLFPVAGRGSVKRTLGSKNLDASNRPFIEIENDMLPLPLAIAIRHRRQGHRKHALAFIALFRVETEAPSLDLGIQYFAADRFCHGYLVWQPTSNTFLKRSWASRQQIFPVLHPD